MSYSFDVFERYINASDLPREVKIFSDALHDYSHKHDDELNRDNRIRKAAQKLEEWMDKQQAALAHAPEPDALRERVSEYADNLEQEGQEAIEQGERGYGLGLIGHACEIRLLLQPPAREGG